MLVVMQHGASTEDVDRVVAIVEEMGYEARPMPGAQRTAVGIVGNDGRIDASRLAALYQDASGLLDRLLLRLIATFQETVPA